MLKEHAIIHSLEQLAVALMVTPVVAPVVFLVAGYPWRTTLWVARLRLLLLNVVLGSYTSRTHGWGGGAFFGTINRYICSHHRWPIDQR